MLVYLRKKTRTTCKICNLGRISFWSPEHFHRLCNCTYVDFPRMRCCVPFPLRRVSATMPGFFQQAGKYFRLTNARDSGYLAIYDFERSPLIDIRLEWTISLTRLSLYKFDYPIDEEKYLSLRGTGH